jgi:hypothetical protein
MYREITFNDIFIFFLIKINIIRKNQKYIIQLILVSENHFGIDMCVPENFFLNLIYIKYFKGM